MRADQPPHLLPPRAGARVPGLARLAARGRVRATQRSVPAVLAQLALDTGTSWSAVSRSTTTTGAHCVRLAPSAGGPATHLLTLDLPGGRRAARESWVLAHLPQGVPAPRRVVTGTLDGVGWSLDELLPGRPLAPTELAAAAEAVSGLHRASARTLTVDDAALQRWVRGPAEVVRRAQVGPRAPLDRLVAQLCRDLDGRTVTAGWVHGDLWTGNVLAEGGRVTGLIDWDLAAPDELPSHDLLHLVVLSRSLRTGRSLGGVVAGVLAGEAWSSEEQALLEGLPDELPQRDLLLLHWLRYVAAIAVQQREFVDHSVLGWRLHNVRPVLRQL